MNLRDQNTRFSLLKAFRDAIDAELSNEREEHTAELLRLYEESGIKSMDVKLPDGGKVATISLSIPKPTFKITDEQALLDWCQANMPTAVHVDVIPEQPEQVIPAVPEHEVYRLDQGMVDALLKGAKPVDPSAGGLVVDEDGTVVDGVEFVPAGAPKSFSVRYESTGREALAMAYRAGELDHLVAGSTLPALEQSGAVPMGAGPADVPIDFYTVDAVHVPGCNDGCDPIEGHLLVGEN
jgi:hypothetical protein